MTAQARTQFARMYGERVAEQVYGAHPDAWPGPGQWQLEDLHRNGGRGAARAAIRAGDRSAREALAQFEAGYRDLAAPDSNDREETR